MKSLRTKSLLTLAFIVCSTSLMHAQDLSPEVKNVCHKVKTTFANIDNKYSWQCFAGALFHYIGLKKATQNDGNARLLKEDPRFAELQAALAETVKANNIYFIANKLSKFEYIIKGMSLDELAAVLRQRIDFNKNDPTENGKSKCEYKKIIKEIEAVPAHTEL